MRTTMTRDMTSLAELLGQVSEWMATDVVPLPVTGQMPAVEAIRLLERAGARHAWVVEHGRVVGAVTLRALRARHHAGGGRRVAGCMLTTAMMVRAHWPLTRAAMVLRQAGTDGVLVSDPSGRPIGLLTGDDIVRAVASRALARTAHREWSPKTW